MAARKIYFIKGHETAFYVSHFLACTRKIIFPQQNTILERVKNCHPVLIKTAKILRLKEVADIPKDILYSRAVGHLEMGAIKIQERYGISLSEAFTKVVRQVGWQARSEDFEGQIPSRRFSDPQKFLMNFDGNIKCLEEWGWKNSNVTIAQCLVFAAERLELLEKPRDVQALCV